MASSENKVKLRTDKSENDIIIGKLLNNLEAKDVKFQLPTKHEVLSHLIFLRREGYQKGPKNKLSKDEIIMVILTKVKTIWDEVLKHPTHYAVTVAPDWRNRLNIMKSPVVYPDWKVLLPAFARVYRRRVLVYLSNAQPFEHGESYQGTYPPIDVVCSIDGVHFNYLAPKCAPAADSAGAEAEETNTSPVTSKLAKFRRVSDGDAKRK